MLTNLTLMSAWHWTYWTLRLTHWSHAWPPAARVRRLLLQRLRTRASVPTVAPLWAWLALALGRAFVFADVGLSCFDSMLLALLAHRWHRSARRRQPLAPTASSVVPTPTHQET